MYSQISSIQFLLLYVGVWGFLAYALICITPWLKETLVVKMSNPLFLFLHQKISVNLWIKWIKLELSLLTFFCQIQIWLPQKIMRQLFLMINPYRVFRSVFVTRQQHETQQGPYLKNRYQKKGKRQKFNFSQGEDLEEFFSREYLIEQHKVEKSTLIGYILNERTILQGNILFWDLKQRF